jgi:hypothetical protein
VTKYLIEQLKERKIWLMVSKVSVYGKKGITEQSCSHHGNRKQKKEAHYYFYSCLPF